LIDAVVLACSLFAATALHGDGNAGGGRVLGSAKTGDAPAVMLWAWEEPEDLRKADPRRVGVAFLAERIFVDLDVKVVERHQRILVPDGIWAEAVVRVEPGPEFSDSEPVRRRVAEAVLLAARLPGVRGVQVDFDAKASQRRFYANVLREVRAGLPRGERLEMTALVSWCAQGGGWISGLPVDAAVPMEFRLGAHAGNWGVQEPLCKGSLGVATDEPRVPAAMLAGQRMYVFAPRPWTPKQVAQLNIGEIPHDVRGAR
jgi:hypothetical protein